ncbi:MAG: hypothetical protein NTZ40_00370 [Cyanobacteria bacterium]|nr:hypothetical protein [Cyanobacteriota bacterium]
MTAGEAHALVVNVNGQNYDVTTFTGTYNNNISKFATAANGGVMPWWNDSSTADSFTSAVNTGLGLPNSFNFAGPYFGYASGTNIAFDYWSLISSSVQPGGVGKDLTRTWAQVTPAAPSSPAAPSPLPIFGAAAAFGASRQLRKRIKLSGHSLPSTYGL